MKPSNLYKSSLERRRGDPSSSASGEALNESQGRDPDSKAKRDGRLGALTGAGSNEPAVMDFFVLRCKIVADLATASSGEFPNGLEEVGANERQGLGHPEIHLDPAPMSAGIW